MFLSRKSSFTLLETLIGFSLLTILLSTLIGVWAQVNWIQSKITSKEKEIFPLFYTQYRLNYVLTRVLKQYKKETKPNKKFFFYTIDEKNGKSGSESLVFMYDNGGGAGPTFSGNLIGKIYLDKENKLILVSWPSPDRSEETEIPMKKEVLMEGVEKVAFQFYFPEREDDLSGKLPSSSQGWYSEWPLSLNILPLMMKIYLHIPNREEPMVYGFVFAESPRGVLYK